MTGSPIATVQPRPSPSTLVNAGKRLGRVFRWILAVPDDPDLKSYSRRKPPPSFVPPNATGSPPRSCSPAAHPVQENRDESGGAFQRHHPVPIVVSSPDEVLDGPKRLEWSDSTPQITSVVSTPQRWRYSKAELVPQPLSFATARLPTKAQVPTARNAARQPLPAPLVRGDTPVHVATLGALSLRPKRGPDVQSSISQAITLWPSQSQVGNARYPEAKARGETGRLAVGRALRSSGEGDDGVSVGSDETRFATQPLAGSH